MGAGRWTWWGLLAGAGAALLGAGACHRGQQPGQADPADSTVAWNGLEFHAHTQVLDRVPVRIRTSVTVTNTRADTARFSMPGACSVQLLAYRTAARHTTVWDQRRVQICAMVLELVHMAPGAKRTWHGDADAHDILGDSLPAGRYWLAAVLRPAQHVLEVPAGSVDLKPAR